MNLFRACIGACLDLYQGLGISVLVGRLLKLMIKTLILVPLSEFWSFPDCGRKRPFVCPFSSSSPPSSALLSTWQWL